MLIQLSRNVNALKIHWITVPLYQCGKVIQIPSFFSPFRRKYRMPVNGCYWGHQAGFNIHSLSRLVPCSLPVDGIHIYQLQYCFLCNCKIWFQHLNQRTIREHLAIHIFHTMVDDLRPSSDSDDERSGDRDDEKLLKSELKTDLYPKYPSNRPRKFFLILVAGFFLSMWSGHQPSSGNGYLCSPAFVSRNHYYLDRKILYTVKFTQITLKYTIQSYFRSLAPAREAVKYEIVETNTTIDSSNVYMGKPRPEQTLAWEEITKCKLQMPFQKIPEMLMNCQTLREKYRSI